MRLPFLRFMPALAAVVTLGCAPSTEPEPYPLAASAGTFQASLSGGLRETVRGSAAFAPYSTTSGLTVDLQASGGTLRITLGPGALSAEPYFEFPVGEYRLNGLPGIRPVDAGVTLAAVGSVPEAYFGALDGTLQILESTPTKILARFEIDAWYLEGGATDRIRVRGSFWATPAP